MNTTAILVYMTLGEIGLLAIVVAVFMIMRARKIKASTKVIKTTDTVIKTVEADIGSHISRLIKQTRTKLETCNENESRFLEARLQFLEAEAILLSENPDTDDYWQIVSDKLAGLFDAPDEETNPAEAVVEVDALAELDALDLLEDDTEDNKAGDKKGSVTIDTSQQEIGRLRNIISRQHGAIDDLKQTLAEKSQDSGQSDTLAKQLEQIEVAHAQLNMCIDILEKENTRLKQEMKKPYDDSQVDNALLEETRKELDIANDRIDDLQEENTRQTERISTLEIEIEQLQQTLKEREEALQRAEIMSADLSLIDDELETDPEVLKKQIEDISEMLMKKSDELQQLQSDTSQTTTQGDTSPTSSASPPQEQHEISAPSQASIDENDVSTVQTEVDSGDLSTLEDNIPVLEPHIPSDANSILNEADDIQAQIHEQIVTPENNIDATVDEALAHLETFDSDVEANVDFDTVTEMASDIDIAAIDFDIPVVDRDSDVDTASKDSDTTQHTKAITESITIEEEIPVIENLDDSDIVMLDDFADLSLDGDDFDISSSGTLDDSDLDPEFLAALGLSDEDSEPNSQTG